MSPKILWVLIGVGFLLVPVADTRPIPPLPLYPLDFIFLAIIIVSFIFLERKTFLEHTFSVTGLVLGIFLLSSVLSWWVNGATLTGLGQLKSWLLLPVLAGIFFTFVFKVQKNNTANLLQGWFAGLLTLLFIVMFYYFLDLTTFDGRLQGPFTSPNFLAFFLFPGILISYYFWEEASYFQKKVLFTVAGLSFAYALFLTHSFGATLAAIGAFVWYFFRRKFFGQHLKIFAILVLFAGIFVGGELLTSDKFASIGDERSSLSSRFIIWEVSVKAIQDNPLFGIGIGEFQEVYLSYQPLFPPYLEWAVPQPHNLLLALWLQAGLVGFLALTWLIVQAFLRNKNPNQEQLILQALFVGMLLYGIFDTPLFGNALAFIWWTVLAFLLFPILKKEKSPQLVKSS